MNVNRDEGSSEDFFIDGIRLDDFGEKTGFQSDWVVPVQLAGTLLNFKVDTGAQADVMPIDVYKSLELKPPLEATSEKLQAYGGYSIKTLGKITVTIQYKEQSCESNVIIVEKGNRSILGLDSCECLGIIRRVDDISVCLEGARLKYEVLKKYPKVFAGIGCLKQKYKIQLKENYTPVIQVPRRVPYAINQI